MVWNFGGSDILIPVRKELVEWNEADTESFGVQALACSDWAHPKGWTPNRSHPFFAASGCLRLVPGGKMPPSTAARIRLDFEPRLAGNTAQRRHFQGTAGILPAY